MANPAEQYNKVKSMTFAILHKDGKEKAYGYLNSQFEVLPRTAWYGLKAELDFFTGYQQKFALTPSLDYGIKCDFSGFMGNAPCRIDVTTNIDFKHLADYDKLQSNSGIPYKIVVMNKETGRMEDIFDLNFRSDNQGGKVFDIALFMPMDYNSNGGPRYNPYQRIVSVNSSTGLIIKEKQLVTDWYLPDIHTKMAEINECYQDYEDDGTMEKQELDSYLAEAAKLLSKSTDLQIVGCAQTNNEIIDHRTCETEEVTHIYWKHPVIEEWLGNEIFEY